MGFMSKTNPDTIAVSGSIAYLETYVYVGFRNVYF